MNRIFPAFLGTFLPWLAIGEDLLESTHREENQRALSLLADGVDPNEKNRYGVMPLSVACANGNGILVEALLDAGADPNAALPGGESVLMTAARTGKPEVVEALLAKGAKVDATEQKGQTALIWATAEGHTEVVRLLIKAGADPEKELKSGLTPLLIASRNGHIDTVRTLLKTEVDVDYAIEDGGGGKAPPSGTSALRLAIENGHFDLAVVLLEGGANPDDQRSGYAPLHVLTWVRKPHRGDGNDGLPPPRGSGELDSLGFARVLVEQFEADVDVTLEKNGSRYAKKGSTPFLLAAHRADLPYLKLLHELGADPEATNSENVTALLAASGVGSHAPEEEAGNEADRLEVLPWLFDLGLDVNAVDRQGNTSMHGAAYKNVPEVARWLAEHGADIEIWNQKNRRNWTPLLIAQGFRPGNFKPDAASITAIEEIMRAEGLEPPPAPQRPVVGKKQEYQP